MSIPLGLIRAARSSLEMQDPKNHCHLGTIAQLCRAISSQRGTYRQSEKIIKQQYLPHMSLQYRELRPTAEIVLFDAPFLG